MNDQKRIQKLAIQISEPILTALKKMDSIKKKMLLVFDGDRFANIISIGDIQRAILKNISLETSIKEILRIKTRIARSSDTFDSIKEKMYNFRIECMPVVDRHNSLVSVYFWEDIFSPEIKLKTSNLKLPVVIMAGGKGTRLVPLTNVIPKPLIPIGRNTIVEEIMDRFVAVGCSDFYLSINHKAEMIKHYFSQLKSNKYNLKYFQEDKPLGTVGSLFLIKDIINTTFFISNCDIIIEEDYSEILKYHRNNSNELTIVSVLKHYPIPYGIIETKKEGLLSALKEKPEYTFQINSGMYILEPNLLNEIPTNEFFHITQLIDNIKKRNGRVGVFPVSEGSWKDIGSLSEYLKKI